MGDSSRGGENPGEAAMSKPNKKKRPFVPYVADPQLLHRVDKYLDEKMDHEVIDREAMVEDLRMQYREYMRRNKAAFRTAVFKAFNVVMQASLNPERREEQMSSELDLSSDDSQDVIDEDDDVYINRIKSSNPATCSKRSNGSISYIQSVKKMTSCTKNNSSNQELINISSDDDDDEKEANPTKITTNMAEKNLVNKKTLASITVTPIPKDTDVLYETRKATTPMSVSELQNRDVQRAQVTPVGVTEANTNSKKRKALVDLQTSILKKQKIEARVVPKQTFKDFGGKKDILETVSQVIMHMKHPEIYRKLGVSPPRGFLLHGPPGSGKTLLAHAIAGELDVPLVKVAAPELVAGVSGESELRIRELFEEAVAQAPSVLFIDEVDAITPRRDMAHKDMERRIVAQLLSSLDELSERKEADQVLVIGATNRADSLDPALRRAGRFDREICLGIPDSRARESILRVLCSRLRLADGISLSRLADLTPGYVGADLKALTSEAAIAAVNRIISKSKPEKETVQNEIKSAESSTKKSEGDKDEIEILNSVTNGTKSDDEKTKEVGSTAEPSTNSDKSQTEDKNMEITEISKEENERVTEKEKCSEKSEQMEVVVDEKETKQQEKPAEKTSDDSVAVREEGEQEVAGLCLKRRLTEEELEGLYIETEDFMVALKAVQPSAKREGFATVPDVTWDDIGSLHNIRDQLQTSIMMPVKYPKEFAKMGVTSPTGILLCGPPGCGKTLLAKAVANEANINFISVKGPELLNMYVGESERAVRQCFQRARNSQPCVIFFDEIDALCPKRSESVEGSASSRVVNQLLTEMDGVEGRSGVFLMAATNRPDMVDPAVMRPGRFDKILYVGLPDPQDRVDILKALTKNGTKPALGTDVDLNAVGSSELCSGYTGADLSALIKEASILSLTEYITSNREADLRVSTKHIQEAVKKIRPSVSPKDSKMYEAMRLMYAVPGPQ